MQNKYPESECIAIPLNLSIIQTDVRPFKERKKDEVYILENMVSWTFNKMKKIISLVLLQSGIHGKHVR